MKQVLGTFKIGDGVQPKPEWKDDPNQVPTGIVRKIEPWGSEGAIYVEGEKRAFASFVFDLEDPIRGNGT